MRSTNDHFHDRANTKSVFNMVNLVRGLEPEIIPFEIIYDKKMRRGTLSTKIGTKEIKYCSNGAKKINEAFPISMVDPRHSWKIMA